MKSAKEKAAIDITQIDDYEIIHEEIIVHPPVRVNGNLRCEARIMGRILIEGKIYRFTRIVPVAIKYYGENQ